MVTEDGVEPLSVCIGSDDPLTFATMSLLFGIPPERAEFLKQFADDLVMVVLFGHGSFDGRLAKFIHSQPSRDQPNLNRLSNKFNPQQLEC